MRFLITLLLAAGAMVSHGALRYYIFTGRILEIDNTLAGFADSLGIRVGDAAALRFTGPEGIPMRAALFDASGRTRAGFRWTGSALIPNRALPPVPFFVRMEAETPTRKP